MDVDEEYGQSLSVSLPLQYQKWTCLCSVENPPNTYICMSCKTVNEDIKAEIVSRRIYVYPRQAGEVAEERKQGEAAVEDICAFCGRSRAPGHLLCDVCKTPDMADPSRTHVLPLVPDTVFKSSWKCENCEAENFGEANCVRCSMIRKDKVATIGKKKY